MNTPRLEAMTLADLPQVLAIEQSAYSHPWTRGHFEDVIRAGYWARCLWLSRADEPPQRLGHVVAMAGVEESHLLNITVAPAWQGQGWARWMLEALQGWSRGIGAHAIWLEVRESNQPAMGLYRRCGFEAVGRRKDYYPVGRTQREHAVVMKLSLDSVPAP